MGRKKKIESEIKEIEAAPAPESGEMVVFSPELEKLETEVDMARRELESLKIQMEEKKREIENMAVRSDGRGLDAQQKELALSHVNVVIKNSALKEKILKQKEYDNVKVTGRFMNRRAPGQRVKLTYLKYDDDPVKWYTFEDGKVYTIPRGFADQINEYYFTAKFIQHQGELNPDEPHSVINAIDDSNKKYAFVPVNF